MEMERRSGTRMIIDAVDLDKIESLLDDAANNPEALDNRKPEMEWALAQIRRAQKQLRGQA